MVAGFLWTKDYEMMWIYRTISLRRQQLTNFMKNNALLALSISHPRYCFCSTRIMRLIYYIFVDPIKLARLHCCNSVKNERLSHKSRGSTDWNLRLHAMIFSLFYPLIPRLFERFKCSSVSVLEYAAVPVFIYFDRSKVISTQSIYKYQRFHYQMLLKNLFIHKYFLPLCGGYEG